MFTGVARIVAFLLGVLSLQLVSGCAQGTDAQLGISPSAGPEEHDRRGPALWRVADKDTTIYLFGTIHALPQSVDWYRPRIARALESAGELVTEVDLQETDAMPALVMEKAALPEEANLREMLSAEDREQYEETMISLGLPIQAFDRFEPWYAAMTFSLIPLLNAGYETDNGVETILARHFGETKPRHHLETVEFQIDLFDSLPLETQISYLDEVVETVPRLSEELDAMVAAWLDGDAKALAKLMNAQETDPVIYKRIITDRNADWAEWIEERLDEPGTVFVAVGAGHLAGEGSVQEQLKKRGIKSSRQR